MTGPHGDGPCDDVSGNATPSFTRVGDEGVTIVKLCVTDPSGLNDEDTESVTVSTCRRRSR